MALTLFGTNVSPPTRAALMLIELLGVDVKFSEVSLITRDHFKPEYVEKNPQHTVPMLEDENYTIVDSHAILSYLASKFGRDDLYPSDLKSRCLIDQRLYFDATVLFPRLRVVIYDITEKRASGLTESHKKNIEEAYSITEKYLEKTKFIASDNISIADISCVSSISSLNSILPVSKDYIRLHEWWTKLKGEIWYKKNLPGDTTFAIFMNRLLGR